MISVVAGRRGEGIGRLLLEALIVEAQQREIERISPSVEADNPAIFLYADVGFVEVSRAADSPTMVIDCRPR
jgi:ribosomal protein S18 acetylase RimI-like enzyme